MINRILFIFIVHTLLGQIVIDSLTENYLSQKIEKFYKSQRVVSISFSLFKGDLYRYNNVLGFADLKSKEKASIDHKYVLASVSKPITASLMLDLEDQGYFKLEESLASIKKDLPKKLNFIDLLTHTSGFIKVKNFGNYNESINLGDAPEIVSKIPIRSRKKHRYNNMNYALLGSLAETLTKQPFDTLLRNFYGKYSDRETIDLLTNDTYHRDSLRVSYYLKRGWRRYAHEPYRSGLWEPAALITTSSKSLANFMQSIMTDSFLQKIKRYKVSVKKRRLADGTLYEEFYGLGYRLGYRDNKLAYVFHHGFIYGALSTMCYFPEYDIGFVALSNMSPYPKLNYSFGGNFIRIVEKAFKLNAYEASPFNFIYPR